MKPLPNRLHMLMLEHGLSQKDLSVNTRIERSTLTKILNGTTTSPKVETIKTLAKYFNVDIEYLLNSENHEEIVYNGKPLAQNLKDLIKAHGLTSSTLHNHTGIPESVISEIINGITSKPNMKTLQALSNFFSISIPTLLGKTPFKISEASINYHLLTVPFIKFENIEKWLDGDMRHIDKYIKVNRKILGTKAYSISIENNRFTPEINMGETIIADPEATIKNGDIFIGNNNGISIYELLKSINDFMILRELGTNEVLKIEKAQFTNYGVIIQNHFNK